MSENGNETSHLQGLEPIGVGLWKFFLTISERIEDAMRCPRRQMGLLRT